MAGWGQSSQDKDGVAERKLQFAYLDTYSVKECQAKYDKLLSGRAKVMISEDMLCAGNKKADTCAGETDRLISVCVTIACRGQWRSYAAPGQVIPVDSEWGGVIWSFLMW